MSDIVTIKCAHDRIKFRVMKLINVRWPTICLYRFRFDSNRGFELPIHEHFGMNDYDKSNEHIGKKQEQLV